MSGTLAANRSGLGQLADGLMLRRAVPENAEELTAFNGQIHGSGPEQPDEAIAAWARELLSGAHPTCSARDFTVVEHTPTRAVVSSACLIPQVWSYAGIKLGVGRIDLVGTHPDYRRKGLVRAQLQVLHRWSRERGHLVQAITGVPHFYRRFGYEMAVERNAGREAYKADLECPARADSGDYRLRPPQLADMQFLADTYAQGMRRYLLSCTRNDLLWRHEAFGRGLRDAGSPVAVVERSDGWLVGLVVSARALWDRCLEVFTLEVARETNWLAVMPAMIRHLLAKGNALAPQGGLGCERIRFSLGSEHPVYDALAEYLPRRHEPQAFFLRIDNPAALVRAVRRVLERRLARSVLTRYTGELRLSFYGDGLQMQFAEGKLVAVEPWAKDGGPTSAAFPYLTFVQLLSGYRSLSELRDSYADCWVADGESRLLLNLLFPKLPSCVWPLA